MKMQLLSSMLFLWACGWSHAQSTIRISAYPYPDPPGYGMKLEPRVLDARPKRNATHVDSVKDPASLYPADNTSFPIETDEGDEGEEEQGRPLDPTPVNRMGLAAGITRRKVPRLPQGPRRRSSVGSATERSTTPRSFGNVPSFLPPSPPQAGGNIGPPAIPGIGSAKPPAPPVFPPSTPEPSLTGSDFGPPAIPDPVNSPSPPPGADEARVSEIRCMDTPSTSSFMALMSLPAGYNAIPVFEDRPSVDPTINTDCRMIPTQITNDMFQAIVNDLERCGVRKCRQSNGETWLCLRIRFPLVNGLKLPEDEIILIRCRPQDKKKSDTQYLTVSTANNGQSVPSVFDGGQHDFRCEIGLFRKLPGTEIYASRVTGEVEVELGEEVQLRSIVKAGDGWQYSLLTTVIIQKTGETRTRSILSAADLVFADGCRNPSYKVIAKNHPKRDPRNPLINNFTFRIFMFQDMDINDNLMITANVIGCVDAQDCAPTPCNDDEDLLGYGKRKKRGVREFSFTTILPARDLLKTTSSPPYPPPSSPPSHQHQQLPHARLHDNTTSWERNLNIKVKIPDTGIHQKPVEAHECQLYLFITLGVAAIFCVASIVFVIVTLFRSRSSPKRYHTQVPVSHISSRAESPGTLTSSASTSSSSSSICSSSVLSSKESVTSAGNSLSPLRNFVVPPTVRQRKREVNTELMNVFESERLFPYSTYCPGMLNYYGYMVVPRKSSAEVSDKKRSLRAIKRDLKKQRVDRQEHQLHHQPHHQSQCHCSDRAPQQPPDEEEKVSQSQNHKSVIHIPGRQPTASSHSFLQGPKAMPRMKREEEDENIYSEVYSESNPTMV